MPLIDARKTKLRMQIIGVRDFFFEFNSTQSTNVGETLSKYIVFGQ
jgi:hypothetical protein